MRPVILILTAAVLGACASGSSVSTQASEATAPANAIAADLWEYQMQQWPRWATFIGDRRFDDRLRDLSLTAQAQWLAQMQAFLDRTAAVDASTLAGQEKLTLRVMQDVLQDRLRTDVCHTQWWQVDQLSGDQARLPQLGTYQLVDSLQAAAAYVTRLAAIGPHIDQHIDNLRHGAAQGYHPPAVAVERVIAQLEAMLAKPIKESPFLRVVPRAHGLSKAELDRLAADIEAVVLTGVRPAWQRYADYLQQSRAAARDAVGVSEIPTGAECYRALILHHTGVDKSAEEIHAVGLAEIARLHAEMNLIAKAEGYADFRAYEEALKASPEQHVQTREALLEHNRTLVQRAQAQLPKVFGILPPANVDVKAIEEFREADAPIAYYYPASDDGGRSAFYYVNTYEPETRPLYNMEALAYHEAVPGHHLQIAIAQGLELPDFRRHVGMTAYVEGWALYAEIVADELGLYSTPATKLGMLNFQAWRAARLVVDTGMHAMGWDRVRALKYLVDNLAIPEAELANEIDRYIIWPGQALAYMLGRIEIQSLRDKAAAALGDRFDVRAFHDRVLENGAVPLTVLRELIDAWIVEVGPVSQ